MCDGLVPIVAGTPCAVGALDPKKLAVEPDLLRPHLDEYGALSVIERVVKGRDLCGGILAGNTRIRIKG